MDVLEQEVDDAAEPEPRTLSLRRPDVPTTVGELATLKSEAIEIINARITILETVRKAAIRATHPEDWILFKSPDHQGGQIVGYLQDAGCDRVRDFWGIEVFGISVPEKISTNDPRDFHYLIRGSGRCKLTRQVVEEIEGGRSSKDDFCKDKQGADLELSVRKAARANLDGNITRELASLKSVPLDEIREAWAGTAKKIEQCRRGRGFGTGDERQGRERPNVPNVEPPKCRVCGSVGVVRNGSSGRPDFYGCPNWKKHENDKWTVEVSKWVEEQKAKPAPAQPATPTNSAPQQQALREPGEEG